jgi:hypothetical protein
MSVISFVVSAVLMFPQERTLCFYSLFSSDLLFYLQLVAYATVAVIWEPLMSRLDVEFE